MAIIVTVRPNSRVSGDWTSNGGAASPQAALSDNLDTTWMSAALKNASYTPAEVYGYPVPTNPGGRKVLGVQVRVRSSWQQGVNYYPDHKAYLGFATGTYTSTYAGLATGGAANGSDPQIYNYSSGYRTTNAAGAALTDADLATLRTKHTVGESGANYPVRFFETYIDIKYSDLPSAPTGVTPVSGSTVNKNNPSMVATASAHPDGLSQSLVFEWATDPGFTQNVRTKTVSIGTGGGSYASLLDSWLFAGTWYYRVRVLDSSGGYSPASATATITVSHPSSGIPNYPYYGTDEYSDNAIQFAWSFDDPAKYEGDGQTAYQIEVSRNDDGTVLYDTGKVTSGVKSLNVPSTTVNLPQDTQLRWRMQAWDQGDQSAGWSAYVLFKVAVKPTVTAVTPTAAAVINNAAPLIDWTFTAGGTRTQQSYRVQIVNKAGTSTLSYDSGTVSSSSSQHQIPSAILANNGAYTLTVTVTDSESLTNSYTLDFTAAWTPGAHPVQSKSTSNLASKGYIDVNWTNSNRDSEFYAWRVYRLQTGPTTFDGPYTDPANPETTHTAAELIYETTTPTASIFQDFKFRAGALVGYSVRQVVLRFGSLVESSGTDVPATLVNDDHYWLIDSDRTGFPLDIRLSNVSAEDFTEEYERNTQVLIGRGRRTDYGNRIGFSGSLTCNVFTGLQNGVVVSPRVIRRMMETYQARKRAFYLRNPFGDIYLVTLGDISMSRVAGVSTNEYFTMSLSYVEVN